jgi:hypothetical protein
VATTSTAMLFGGAPAALAATVQPTAVAKAPTTAPSRPLLPTTDPFYTYTGPLWCSGATMVAAVMAGPPSSPVVR